jgi:hypothetical protein
MARLWDTSRDKISGGEGYSLEELSRELVPNKMFEKVNMKDIFGVPKLKKDGEESKVKVIPEMRELQTSPQYRDKWIEYSAKDAIATWYLREELESKLKQMTWFGEGQKLGNMYEFYLKYFAVFGEVLTDMERNGIKVDTQNHLRLAELRAREDRDAKEKLFLDWASTECEDARLMNTASTLQLQHFLFGKYIKKVHQNEETIKIFQIDKLPETIAKEEAEALRRNPYVNCTVEEMKNLLKEKGCKTAGKRADLMTRLLQHDIDTAREMELAAGNYLPQHSSQNISEASEAFPLGDTNIEDRHHRQVLEDIRMARGMAPLPSSTGTNLVTTLDDIDNPNLDDIENSNNDSEVQTKSKKYKKIPKTVKLTPYEVHNNLLREKYGFSEEKVQSIREEDNQKIAKVLAEVPKVSSYFNITIKSLGIDPVEFTPAGNI